jgi:hypothetical protein
MSLDPDVVVRDVRRFVADPRHRVQVHGTVRCAGAGHLAKSAGTEATRG